MPTECVWHDEPPEAPWHTMATNPRLIQLRDELIAGHVPSYRPTTWRSVGACFPSRPTWRVNLSKHYLAQEAAGERAFPITVMLPTRGGGACEFCIDDHPTGEPDAHWTVTIDGPLVAGARPPLTVDPSINCVGLYHGHLQGGVLTDDSG